MTLHYLLMSNHSLIQKFFFEFLNDKNLSMGQPKILDYLKEHDGAIQKDIAASCHIEAASLSSILNGMEKNDFIIRKIDLTNRRQTKIYLSDKAKAILSNIECAFTEAENIAFKGMSDEEKEKLLLLLQKSYKNLKETSRND